MSIFLKPVGLGLSLLAVASLIFWYVANNLWWPMYVPVQPGQNAVLVRDGEVVTVLGPGLQSFNAATEELTVYDTELERQHIVRDAVVVDACPATVTIRYNVSGVAEFHASGGDFAIAAGIDAPVREALATLDLRLDQPLTDAMRAVHTRLQEEPLAGLHVFRVSGDFGDCGPPPPRIVQRRLGREPIETTGQLGTEQVEIRDLALTTGDDMRLQLQGAVATFDVTNASLAVTCFGNNPDAAGAMIMSTTGHALRAAVGGRPSRELAAAFAAVADTWAERNASFVTDCGVVARAIDYSEAELWQVEQVDCTETPDVAVCLE